MEVTFLLQGIDRYGLLIVFLVVFLEYLNLPGFPAGVILPFSGVWAARGHSFLITLFVTVVAGILGSILLYYVGKFGGSKLLRICMGKSERVRKAYEALQRKIERQGSKAVFLSKLVPVLRTLVGIPAGAMNMNLMNYVISSTLGICIWNGILVSAGYFFGVGVMA